MRVAYLPTPTFFDLINDLRSIVVDSRIGNLILVSLFVMMIAGAGYHHMTGVAENKLVLICGGCCCLHLVCGVIMSKEDESSWES